MWNTCHNYPLVHLPASLSSFLSPFLIFFLPPPQISYVETLSRGQFRHLLAIPSKEKLLRVIEYLLDEDEFLSPYGIRSLSKVSQSVRHQTYVAPFIPDHLQYAEVCLCDFITNPPAV